MSKIRDLINEDEDVNVLHVTSLINFFFLIKHDKIEERNEKL